MAYLWSGLTVLFLLVGMAFMAIAALGIRYMPDTYLRMSASTKASTLGSAGLLIAAGFHFREVSTGMIVLLTIFFLLLTAPIGAHIIGRAGYRKHKAPLWSGTVVDDLKQFEAERKSGQPPS